MTTPLHQQWLLLCEGLQLKAELCDFYWEEICSHYGGMTRYYHNLLHLEELLDWLAIYEEQIIDKEIFQLSIWYHDIIYVAGRKDNEWESAEFARMRLPDFGLSANRIEQCCQQILATKSHQLLNTDPDLPYLLDFDLAILAKPWANYQVYAQQIRKEFQVFPDDIYQAGRKKALQSFLARPSIYHTPALRDQLEEQARQNIQAEIALL